MYSNPNWTRTFTGKVHDVYTPIDPVAYTGGESLMLVSSDRMSVLDRVMPVEIPGKGEVVHRISRWWFAQLADIAPNHYLSEDVPDIVRGRAMIVRRLRMFPFELAVVGYMTQALDAQYRASGGTVSGVELPPGLAVGDKLAEPIFLPEIKGEVGADDEPITFEQMTRIAGVKAATKLRGMSLALYNAANHIAEPKGLVIADVKLEFGASSDYGDDEYVLADQAFTPDTATYWIADEVAAGRPRSFGKDYVRDAIEAEVRAWIDGSGRTPDIPSKVVEEMSSRYRYVEFALTQN